MTRVLVIGSINMDMVVNSSTMPRLGETLSGSGFATYPGGKGANQAVAAARLGAQVSMIGCVGRDAFGAELKAVLANEGVDTCWVSEVDVATGVASITLCGSDNAIIVVPGANHALLPAQLDAAEQAFADADVVLAQLEVPLATVEHAALLAARHGKPFLLNPAPAVALPAALLARVSVLTPNEFELATTLASQQPWRALVGAAAGRIVMTHGADGAFFADAGGQLQHQPGFAVTPVDTTGAGDTFNGALATFLHLGLAEAVRRAAAAGAVSVTQPGAQGGMPTLAALDTFLQEHDA